MSIIILAKNENIYFFARIIKKNTLLLRYATMEVRPNNKKKCTRSI